MLTLELPDPALVLLIGPSGAGKSTFARRHFGPTEIISSDHCRALVCDDEGAQHVNLEAFGLAHHLARLRLQLGKMTVFDATNLEARARRPLLKLARRQRVSTVAVVFNVKPETCLAQNRQRRERLVPEEVISQQLGQLAQTLPRLERENYGLIYLLTEHELVDLRLERVKKLAD